MMRKTGRDELRCELVEGLRSSLRNLLRRAKRAKTGLAQCSTSHLKYFLIQHKTALPFWHETGLGIWLRCFASGIGCGQAMA